MDFDKTNAEERKALNERRQAMFADALARLLGGKPVRKFSDQPVECKSRAPVLDEPVRSLSDLRKLEEEMYPTLTLIERSRTVEIITVNGQVMRREVVVYAIR